MPLKSILGKNEDGRQFQGFFGAAAAGGVGGEYYLNLHSQTKRLILENWKFANLDHCLSYFTDGMRPENKAISL